MHAWEVPIAMLTAISNIMNYKKGYILDDDYLDSILKELHLEIDFIQPHKYSECLWVYLGENEANTIHEIEACALLRQHLNIASIFLKQIPRHFVPGTFQAAEYLVLLPKECLRLILTTKPIFEFTQDPKIKRKEVLFDRDDLYVGMLVQLVPFEQLIQLCCKYFSWDRAPISILRQLADNTCEIISISPSNRIGVRVPDSPVCEVVPIEALRPYEDSSAHK